MALSRSYFARGHIFVLVHDLNNSTLEDMRKWYNIVKSESVARHDPVVIIASNKCDGEVPFCESETETWIRNNELEHIYCSAKTGEGIQQLFIKIEEALQVHQRDFLSPSLPSLPSLITGIPIKKAEGCNCG